MVRVRIHYTKQGGLRYTGNLDMQKIWERIFRRAGIPLAYSQGFHPQPRLTQACPLPLGMISQAELIDSWLDEDNPAEDLATRLQSSSPPGLVILSVEQVDLRQASLPILVQSALYHVTLKRKVDLVWLETAVHTFLDSSTCLRERRGKKYDLRTLVEELKVTDRQNGECFLEMQLSAREAATGRPDEVLLALGLDPNDSSIERINLAIS